MKKRQNVPEICKESYHPLQQEFWSHLLGRSIHTDKVD
jgi:hypothetical protein